MMSSSGEVRAAGLIVFRRAAAGAEYLLLQSSRKEAHWTPPKGVCRPLTPARTVVRLTRLAPLVATTHTFDTCRRVVGEGVINCLFMAIFAVDVSVNSFHKNHFFVISLPLLITSEFCK